MKQFLDKVIDIMDHFGVDYGDVRVGFYAWQNIFTRDAIVTNISNDFSEGMGIRVRVGGGWGFVASQEMSESRLPDLIKKAVGIARASSLTGSITSFAPEEPHNITWKTPYEIDPFDVPISEKTTLLLDINQALKKRSLIKRATSFMRFSREHKYFRNTEGTYTNQLLLRVFAQCTATAVNHEGFESRTCQLMPLNTGYEHLLNADLLQEADRISEEAIGKLKARICPQETTDLILLPSHTALTIHETIGHATELDRVMGWEADMAGTSFATIDKLHKLKYGSSIFNVTADRTMAQGRATVPVDDEGVATGKWYLIRNGILEGYATTRCTAHYIGETRSRGCSYADSWQSIPILRMANVSIEPGPPGSPSLDELIADTRNGVLVDGMGSFSIDHQRINFQFGGDCAWRINNGKIGEILRRFTYQSHNPVFWNSVDAVCHAGEWKPFGVVNCGKGQPLQLTQLTHGSAPLRLKQVHIGRAKI